MKVEGSAGPKASGKPRPAAAKPFGETLRTASRAARSAGARPQPAEGAGEQPARAAASRRAGADRADDALRSRREAFREEARLAPPPPAASPPSAVSTTPEAPATPELRALVRTLPLAIRTFGVRDGAPLALSFGRALDVEIRPAARGIELLLRPDPRLARASEAELPALVAALRARGVAVARAEVRARGAPRPGDAAPRVDLAAGLR